ncbi:hypothetical protein LTR17_025557 [Elasticomyces elasticus]|nr:hypothetical protein LTR17_025557 [Elasticomyces elasticus]
MYEHPEILSSRRRAILNVQADTSIAAGIDALSINQQDLSEKEKQVPLMGAIYEGAKEVLIGVCEQLPRDDHASVRRWLEGLLIDRHLTELDCFSTRGLPSTAAGLSRNPFLALVQSPWFSRTWTVQEFCLGQHATLICPWGDVSWDVFVKAFLNWNKHVRGCCKEVADMQPELMEECHRVYCHIKSLEHMRRSTNSQHILQTILLFMHLDVADLRDKVYGLRALHRGTGDLPLPEYRKSVPGVFEDFTVWAIQDVQGLFPLAFDLHQERSETPSWVMDLSMQPTIDVNYWRRRLSGVGLHNAAAGIPYTAELVLPGCLLVQGVQVGHVEAVTELLSTLPKCNADLVNILRAWHDFAIDQRPDSLLLDRVDSVVEMTVFDDWFCRTMLANQVEDTGTFRQAQESDIDNWKATITDMTKMPFDAVDYTPVVESHMTAVLGRRMFRLSTGHLGVSNAYTQIGDALWVLGGGTYLQCVPEAALMPTAVFR